MPDSYQRVMEKAQQEDSFMRSTIAMLELYQKVSEPRRADLLELAIKAIAMVEKDIYENELSGVARLKQ
jgi:hypothetical protein